MKAKTYTQPNYDSVEEMMEFLLNGVVQWEILHYKKFKDGYIQADFSYDKKDETIIIEYEPDLKTALRKCCEERISKGL